MCGCCGTLVLLKASERGTFPVCYSGHYNLSIQLRVCVADSLPHVPRLSWSLLDASGGEYVSIATGRPKTTTTTTTTTATTTIHCYY